MFAINWNPMVRNARELEMTRLELIATMQKVMNAIAEWECFMMPPFIVEE